MNWWSGNNWQCNHWCSDNSRGWCGQCLLISLSKRKLLFELGNTFFGCCQHVGDLIDASSRCCRGCQRFKVVHQCWNNGCVGVMTNPLVNLIFDESTWDIVRCKLTVRKNEFAFSILLALALIDVCLAYQAVTNEISGKSAKDTKKIFDLVRMEVHVCTRCTVRFRTC